MNKTGHGEQSRPHARFESGACIDDKEGSDTPWVLIH